MLTSFPQPALPARGSSIGILQQLLGARTPLCCQCTEFHFEKGREGSISLSPWLKRCSNKRLGTNYSLFLSSGGGCTIKLFTMVIYVCFNMFMFHTVTYFCHSLIFDSKIMCLVSKWSSLLAYIRQVWKCPLLPNALAYFTKNNVLESGIIFTTIHYLCNLRISPLRSSVRSCQAFHSIVM